MTAITDYRTVYIRSVLPPKYDKPLPKPTLSLAQDAARCNARLNRSWDVPGPGSNGAKTNAIRAELALQRDAAFRPVILELLSDARLTRPEIEDATGLSREVTKRILQAMREEGLIHYSNYGRRWSLK